MSVRKTIEAKAFGGRRALRRGVTPKIQVITSGAPTGTALGMITYSVATTGCYIAVNTAGTGTKFNV